MRISDWSSDVCSSDLNGVILGGYIGSFLMAGGYLAVGSCLSAITKNQVIAFVISVLVCFVFTVAGAPMVLSFFQGWAPPLIVDTIASFSFLTHFNAITERSEEHTSELQSLMRISYAVFCLKKKKK